MNIDQTTVNTLVGAAIPLVAAFVKMVFKMKSDLNRAFSKIRELQK